MSILEKYQKFAVRGNVVDMAVGIIVGAAFNGVVQSLVKDVLTSPRGLLMGDVDFTNLFVTLREGTPAAPTVKKCPHCTSDVPVAATRCPHCTSDLPAESVPEDAGA